MHIRRRKREWFQYCLVWGYDINCCLVLLACKVSFLNLNFSHAIGIVLTISMELYNSHINISQIHNYKIFDAILRCLVNCNTSTAVHNRIHVFSKSMYVMVYEHS